MTEQDREIQELRRQVEKLSAQLKSAIRDLIYLLNQRSLCEICEYRDDDCWPDSGSCVPKWRGLDD